MCSECNPMTYAPSLLNWTSPHVRPGGVVEYHTAISGPITYAVGRSLKGGWFAKKLVRGVALKSAYALQGATQAKAVCQRWES
jgi:hypothetical protein